MTIGNMAAGQIAIKYGLKGMCTCVTAACAGGANAVGDAFRHIRDGYADVMLCGGAESAVTPLAIGAFTSMKALTQNPDPKRASIPFDAERSGFVLDHLAGRFYMTQGCLGFEDASIVTASVSVLAEDGSKNCVSPSTVFRSSVEPSTRS